MLRRLKEDRGIALEEIGDRVGLDWRILAGMERGSTRYFEDIEQIARALDMQTVGADAPRRGGSRSNAADRVVETIGSTRGRTRFSQEDRTGRRRHKCGSLDADAGRWRVLLAANRGGS